MNSNRLLSGALAILVGTVLLVVPATQAQQLNKAETQALQSTYGPNYEEILAKYGDEPEKLQELANTFLASKNAPPFYYHKSQDDHYVVGSEMEPNDWFDTANDLNSILMTPGYRGDEEFTGGLVSASFTEGDFDVYVFDVDTTKMYYFAGTHSYPGTVNTDASDPAVSMRLFHESDLDTTFVENFAGIDGNDQISGDILGEATDHRANSGDFRLTGWVSPIDAATGAQLTGKFYLFLYNGEGGGSPKSINSTGETGTYHFGAYTVDMEPWVSKYEPNQTFEEALLNLDSALPLDGVVRTFMGFNPDTVKIVKPTGSRAEIRPTQSNSVYPQLLAQGDEDVDHFRLDGLKAGHTLVVETLPFFGYYRDTDGSMGPGNTRWTDTRCRLYDADYTTILLEDDDAGREIQSTSGQPNNIHCRMVYPIQEADLGGPLWLWVSAWASATRSEGQSVDNRDPGRFMYDIYVHQYPSDYAEVEPNNTVAEAMDVGVLPDTVYSGSISGAGDTDNYRIFLHSQRVYSIFSRNSSIAGDLEVELMREYESDNMGGTMVTSDLLASSVAGNAGDGDFVIGNYVPEESGAYIISLSAPAAGSYELGIIDKGEIFDALILNEPDDDLADALAQEALQVGPGADAVTAAIWPAGDVDNYHFTVPVGFDLLLSLEGTHDLINDANLMMTLYGPDGSQIASDPGLITHTTVAAGTYGLTVMGATDEVMGLYRLSGGLPFEETEDNNSFATADLIALNSTYEARLTQGDVDYFKFTLEVGKLYSFRSVDNQTGGPLTVGFYDEMGGESLMDDSGWPNNYSGDNFKIASIIPLETKTYYLSVSGGTGFYKITSRVNDNLQALYYKGEPNNSKSEADAMGDYQAFGVDQTFVLANLQHPRQYGDQDWFRVNMTAGQTLTAETTPVGGEMWSRDTDTRLVILDGEGTTELVNDDDGGQDWYSKAEYQATVDGPLYVQVRTSRTPSNADDRTDNRGDYIVNIDVSSSEVEPNNSFSDAAGNTLAAGLIDSEFSGLDPIDIYKLDLMADHIYHIRTVRVDGGYQGDHSARLFKGSNTSTNLLNEASTGYNTRYSGNLKLNIIPDETAEYFLELSSDGTDGAYQVGLKSTDISDLKSKGEPNNSVEEANAVGAQAFDLPGQVNTYMLYNENFPWDPSSDHLTAQYGQDLDFYRYDLMAGDTLVAESSPVHGPLWPRDYDGYMELYDAEGNQIATNDDGGYDWHSKITHVAEADESVYVMLRSQDHNEGANGGGTDRDPARGEYNLTVLKMDGSQIWSVDTETEVPSEFVLNQNYPNPFNPTTTISYALPEILEVRLEVFDLLGRRVALLVDSQQSVGTHTISFNASRLASGIYIYRLRAGEYMETKKMMVIK